MDKLWYFKWVTHVFSKIDRDKLGTKDSDSFPPAPPPLISPGGAEQIASVDDTMDDSDDLIIEFNDLVDPIAPTIDLNQR